MFSPQSKLEKTGAMAERSIRTSPRPKPGPRVRTHHGDRSPTAATATPRRSTHGVAKRRVPHVPPTQRSKKRADEPTKRTRRRSTTAPQAPAVERVETPQREREPRPPIDRAVNRRWWLGVVVIALIAFGVAIFEAPTFEAANTQVSGHARTNEGTILSALDIAPDQALITYDTNDAADRLRELPWVERASVVRQWPSSVRVVIRERAVTAGVGDPTGQRWMVLGEDRIAIEERRTPPASVPLIVVDRVFFDDAVIGEPMDGINRAYDLALNIPNQLKPWVSTWALDEQGSVTANLTGSAKAIFGPAGDGGTQFVSLASILDGGPVLTCIDTIDLSTADTPVVHRDASCLVVSSEIGS